MLRICGVLLAILGMMSVATSRVSAQQDAIQWREAKMPADYSKMYGPTTQQQNPGQEVVDSLFARFRIYFLIALIVGVATTIGKGLQMYGKSAKSSDPASSIPNDPWVRAHLQNAAASSAATGAVGLSTASLLTPPSRMSMSPSPTPGRPWERPGSVSTKST